jgi:retron-type reverse transcriptase
MILNAYYDVQFSDHSHGFREERGCHTALREMYYHWAGATWVIEGDISDCFGSLNHELLLTTLREKIHDGRFIKLISKLLDAGYLEDWRYNQTLSGVPQGSLCKALHNDPYAKWKAMQSKGKKSLKRRHFCPIYLA